MGFHLIPNNLNVNFVGMRKISYAVSILLILAGFAAIAANGGLKYGIDFAGGTVVQIKFSKAVEDEAVKAGLSNSGLPNLVVQEVGTDHLNYLLRISNTDEMTTTSVREAISGALGAAFSDNPFEIQRLEMVGPKVGADLRSKAVEAVFVAMILIAIYVSGRFEQRWGASIIMAAALGLTMYVLNLIGIDKMIMLAICGTLTLVLCWKLKLVFAVGALVSILHDILITIGVLALLGKEFDLTIIAALLTIVGYSLNDTIIVYDRIRENLRNTRKTPLATIINRSLNQTMSRTVLTSGTTLLTIGSLLVFGGDIIHDFSLVMFLGVFIGTASSIFVASPVLLIFGDSVVARAEKDAARREAEAKRPKRAAQV